MKAALSQKGADTKKYDWAPYKRRTASKGQKGGEEKGGKIKKDHR